MRLLKYTEGWTRRHFLDQVGRGVFAAGVLSPLMDVIGRHGTVDAAYPPELLSIEAYTKGKLKPGDVLNAENVDIVKDLLDPGAYYQIKHDGRLVDLAPMGGGSSFKVAFRDRKTDIAHELADLHLPMPGRHNALNATAAIAVAHELGLSDAMIRKAIAGFGGVKRRFTKTGEWNGVTIIDDYGHHPVEIAAVLKAARESTNGKIIAVVQPHRFTRLQSLFEEFCTCFNDADTVVVAEVYPAGEAPIPGIDRDQFVLGLRAHGHREVIPLPESGALAGVVHGIAGRGDFIVCLGAGNITQWAYALPDQLKALG